MTSIAQELLQVATLAGVAKERVRHWLMVVPDQSVQESGIGNPPTTIEPFFTINVPQGRCLVITQIDVDSYPVNSSGAELYSHRQPHFFNEGLTFVVQVDDQQTTREAITARYFNGAVFFVFPTAAKVEFVLTIPGNGADQMKMSLRLNGYLLPQERFAALSTMQTVISA